MSSTRWLTARILRALVVPLICYAATTTAFAQSDFPNRPIKIVVPYPAGGAADIIARAVGEKLRQELGQPVIIDNRPGANGVVGADYVAKSPADGYTILINGVGPMTIIPHISKVGYDTLTDFKPLTQAVALTLSWVARSDFKYKTIADVVKAQKAGQHFNVATNGNGGPNHLAVEQLNVMTGIRLTPIPYRGEQPAVQDVLAGQVDMVMTSVLSAGTLIKSGKLVAIATNGLQRSKLLPSVPTVDESGIRGYDNNSWQAFFLPAKTPKLIADRLQKALVNALRSEEVTDQLLGLGAEVVANSSEEFDAHLRSEYERYGKLAKALNLKME